MKNFKSIFFLILIVLICPLFTFACGEVGFDDVPYESISETALSAVGKINDARTFMLNGDNLKMKYETTNTYTFYETLDGKVSSKTIKDVYTTNIGVLNENGYVISSIDMTRFVDNEISYTNSQTFVSKYEKNNEIYSYLYTNNKRYVIDEEVENKDRQNFDSTYYTSLKFFNDAVVVVKPEEIDKVYKKKFKKVNYYKLDSVLDGLDVVSDRFEKDGNLQQNPSLYKSLNPSYDSILNLSYEYGINSSNYITYAKLSYNIAQNNASLGIYNEKYLSVNSVTRLTGYGYTLDDSIEPEDKEDYTAQAFINVLSGDEDYYIVYKDAQDSTNTKTTLIRYNINDEQNELFTDRLFNVIVESVEGNAINQTYLVGFDGSSYKAYLIDETNKLYQEVENLSVNVSDFNFENITFDSKEETENNSIVYKYKYGESHEYSLTIEVKNNEVYKFTISKDSSSQNFYLQSIEKGLGYYSVITSLNGYEEGEIIVEDN